MYIVSVKFSSPWKNYNFCCANECFKGEVVNCDVTNQGIKQATVVTCREVKGNERLPTRPCYKIQRRPRLKREPKSERRPEPIARIDVFDLSEPIRPFTPQVVSFKCSVSKCLHCSGRACDGAGPVFAKKEKIVHDSIESLLESSELKNVIRLDMMRFARQKACEKLSKHIDQDLHSLDSFAKTTLQHDPVDVHKFMQYLVDHARFMVSDIARIDREISNLESERGRS